jgi:hypothetical protein
MTERNFTLLNQAITVAEAITTVDYGNIPEETNGITVQCAFVRGGGGTTAKAYVQTTLDGGTTWIDIASFSFTTSSLTNVYNLTANTPKTTAVVPTDGTLTANTVVDGLIGTKLRAKYVTTGTYTGTTTLKIDVKLHN